MKALFAHRIPFGDWWRTFDPSPFLCQSTLQAYNHPEVLRQVLPEGPRKVGDFCVREQKKLIFREWDGVGVLVLFLLSEVEEEYLSGLGAAPKDSNTDRMIMNRTGENRRERRLDHCASRDLPHAVLLCELDLSGEGSELGDFAAVFSADDLRDFYYAFITPMSRTKYNGVQGRFRLSEFAGYRAEKDLKERVGARAEDDPWVVGALHTLSQGDGSAVDIAQEAHVSLGVSSGALPLRSVLAYRAPVPRGRYWAGIIIDDHVGVLKVDAARLSEYRQEPPAGPVDTDSLSFELMNQAYVDNNVRSHPKKRKRRQSSGVFWGGHLDGVRGRSMAPPEKVLAMILLSLCVLELLVVPVVICQVILGGWVYAFMYRRPLFCIFFRIFRDISSAAEGALMRISITGASEIWCACVLSPLGQTDLKAPPSGMAFSADASEFAAGATVTSVSGTESREL
jgi:hypothetical protein